MIFFIGKMKKNDRGERLFFVNPVYECLYSYYCLGRTFKVGRMRLWESTVKPFYSDTFYRDKNTTMAV